jgi:hypothetical protein
MTQNIPEIKNLKEIINILKVVMKQNYPPIRPTILQTNWRISIGYSYISNISQSVYPMFGAKQLYRILLKQQIIGYIRYIDDIFL